MAWKVLVSYLREPSVLGAHPQRIGPESGLGGDGSQDLTRRRKHTPEGGQGRESPGSKDLETFSTLSSTDSFESDDISSSSITNVSSSAASTLTRRWPHPCSLPSQQLSTRQESLESLEALNSNSSAMFLPQSKTVFLTRNGSIRIQDSPLHRGSSLGSPAFRRRKMRAKSDINWARSSTLPRPPGGMSSSATRLSSPNRRSALPVPTFGVVSTRCDIALESRESQHAGQAGPRHPKRRIESDRKNVPQSDPISRNKPRLSSPKASKFRAKSNKAMMVSPRQSRHTSPSSQTSSPRNSVYKDTLIMVNAKNVANSTSTISSHGKPKTCSTITASNTKRQEASVPEPKMALSEVAQPIRSTATNTDNLDPRCPGLVTESITLGTTSAPQNIQKCSNPCIHDALVHNPPNLRQNRPSPSVVPMALLTERTRIPISPTRLRNSVQDGAKKHPKVGTTTPVNTSSPRQSLILPGKRKSGSPSVRALGREVLHQSTPHGLNRVGKICQVNHVGKSSTSWSGSRSRPSSRDLELTGRMRGANSLGSVVGLSSTSRIRFRSGKTSSSASPAGVRQHLAPKAKFRSDGEISMCGASLELVGHSLTQTRSEAPSVSLVELEDSDDTLGELGLHPMPSPVDLDLAGPGCTAPQWNDITMTGEIQSTVPVATGAIGSCRRVAKKNPTHHANVPSRTSTATTQIHNLVARPTTMKSESPRPSPGELPVEVLSTTRSSRQTLKKTNTCANRRRQPGPRVHPCQLETEPYTGKNAPEVSRYAIVEKQAEKHPGPVCGGVFSPITTTTSITDSPVEQNPRRSADVQCWPWTQPGSTKQRPKGAKTPRGYNQSQLDDLVPAHAATNGWEAVHHVREAPSVTRQIKGEPELSGPLGQPENTSPTNFGCEIERGGFFKIRSRSLTFFQRLGGLRRSFNRSLGLTQEPPLDWPHSDQSVAKLKTRLPGACRSATFNSKACKELVRSANTKPRADDDRDWVFFRGFSGKRREDLIEPYSVCHGPLLAIPSSNPSPRAPPKRKRPRRQQWIVSDGHVQGRESQSTLLRVVDCSNPLRRSLSFTDAHFIAQAVYEGDTQLIEELYPDFPRAPPIYTLIDLSKTDQSRKSPQRPFSEFYTNRCALSSLSATIAPGQFIKGEQITRSRNDHNEHAEKSSPKSANPPSRFSPSCGGQQQAIINSQRTATHESLSGHVPFLEEDWGNNSDPRVTNNETEIMENRAVQVGTITTPQISALPDQLNHEAHISTAITANEAKATRICGYKNTHNCFGKETYSDFDHKPSERHELADTNNVTFSCPVMLVGQDDVARHPTTHYGDQSGQLDTVMIPPRTPPLPPLRMDLFEQEPSLVISPWNTTTYNARRPSSASSSESCSERGVDVGSHGNHRTILTCAQPPSGLGDVMTHPHPESQHPFAQHAHRHYSQKQSERQLRHGLTGPYEHLATVNLNQCGDNYDNQWTRLGPELVGEEYPNNVTITTLRQNASCGVTLSPGSLPQDSELLINGDRCGYKKHLMPRPSVNTRSESLTNVKVAPSRSKRCESADRISSNGRFLKHGRSHHQAKKISAPALGETLPKNLPPSFSHIGTTRHCLGIEDLSTDTGSKENTPNGDDPFHHILAKADNSISQAESILSSLRVESHAEIPRLTQKPKDQAERHRPRHEDGVVKTSDDFENSRTHLGSDIESNIRRLEKTQAKINAALETFRSVQAKSHSRNGNIHDQVKLQPPYRAGLDSSRAREGPIATQYLTSKTKNHPDNMRLAFPTESNNSSTTGIRFSGKSLTAPAQMEERRAEDGDPSLNSLKYPYDPESKGRKTSLFRRHSFSLIAASKEKSSGEAPNASEITSNPRSATNLVGGGGSGFNGCANQRSNSLYDEDRSLSDSEGGFLPLRHRLRGFLGSFGKGRKKVPRAGSERTRLRVEGPETSDGIKSGPQVEPHRPSSPMLTTTLGEFTRQIERLSNEKTGSDPPPIKCRDIHRRHNAGNHSDAHLRYRCDEIPNRGASPSRCIILRPKRVLAKNDSADTYASCGSSFNGNSNRNSVISGQSVSSESFDHPDEDDRDRSVTDDEIERPCGSASSSPRSNHPLASGLNSAQRCAKKVYFIAREVMTSERVFVDILRLLNVEFREFIQNARRESKSGIMPDTDFSRLFSNLPELQTLNEDLLQDFEDRVENWDTQKKIADVIVRKGPFLKLYTTYIREFSSVNYHFDDCCQKYPKFGKLVREFEARERCRNLKVKHFMLKPVQRLPQYRLLLEDYLKHLDPDSPDFDDTTIALHIVSEAADHANDTIKQGDKFRRMLQLQSRLGDMELIRPGRELVKEGELQKISRKGMGPRYFVLLSDFLLYCTYSGSWSGDSTNLRVSYKIPLTALQVRVPIYDDFQNEFYITSPVRSCTLRASSVHERNDWLDALNSAIEDHVNRKATFLGINVNGHDNHIQFLSPDEAMKIGNSAPVWIPDRRVTMCQNCAVEFGVLVRRHHCRACGKVICATCSANKAPLRYRDFEAARVCDGCFESLERELNEFRHLKPRFKKRDTTKNLNRYVPQRLKVSANGHGAQMCGYLKRRLKNAKWKRLWFVLKDRVLYAYKASEDAVAADTYPILGYDLDSLSEKNFQLYEGEYAGLVFLLSHPGGESLVFCADNDNICEKWISALREAISFDSENSQADGIE